MIVLNPFQPHGRDDSCDACDVDPIPAVKEVLAETFSRHLKDLESEAGQRPCQHERPHTHGGRLILVVVSVSADQVHGEHGEENQAADRDAVSADRSLFVMVRA